MSKQLVSIIILSLNNYYIKYICTEITVHPQSVNTTLNSTVNFTCEAVADLIDLRVNDMSAVNIDVVSKGFTQHPQEPLNDGRLRRVLTAKTLKYNNNTNISCRAINGKKVYSNIAVLRIQGEVVIYIFFIKQFPTKNQFLSFIN